jgi:hypothetical protein
VKAIAGVGNGAGDHVEYFRRNSDCGIRTFQDDEILALFAPGTWLKDLQRWGERHRHRKLQPV